MPSGDRKLRVFLCHASQDKPVVRELYQRLSAEGWMDPWLDEEKLLPGQDWEIEIEKVVETTDAVIVCISENSVNKEGYVQKEIRKVLDISDRQPEDAIFIIPLRLEECEPPWRLTRWQYLDYFPIETRPKARILLLQSLNRRADNLGIVGEPKTPRYQSVQIESSGKNIGDYIKMKDEGSAFINIHFRENRIDGTMIQGASSRIPYSRPIKELIDRFQRNLTNSHYNYELEIRTPVKSVLLGNILDNDSVFIFKPISNK